MRKALVLRSVLISNRRAIHFVWKKILFQVPGGIDVIIGHRIKYSKLKFTLNATDQLDVNTFT